jgi:aminopeptidase N
MLRDIAGDKQLATALQAYDAAEDTSPEYFEHLVERASGKDLKWFFDNWVYHDRGLPDISIAGVYSSAAAHEGEYLVAVDLANDGSAEVEVPVTVRSHESTLTERVRLPGKTRTVHRMLTRGEPEEVIVNDGAVPEVQTGVHKRAITNKN